MLSKDILNAIKYEKWQNLLQNVYVNTIERKENFQIIFIVCNLYIYSNLYLMG